MRRAGWLPSTLPAIMCIPVTVCGSVSLLAKAQGSACSVQVSLGLGSQVCPLTCLFAYKSVHECVLLNRCVCAVLSRVCLWEAPGDT